MAVDGTTSPVHQHVEARRVKNNLDLEALSSDEAVMPIDEANVNVTPSVSSSRHDDRNQVHNNERHSPVTSSLAIPSAESGSYYFGESHVTRLESFVESLAGPPSHPPVQRSRWSSTSPMECSNGAASVPLSGSSRKAAAASSGSAQQPMLPANQPLDLSFKVGGGHSRQKFNESPLSVGSSDGRHIGPSDMLSASLQAGCYPTIADMWLAHWLSMASAASSLLTHMPLQLPVNQHLYAASSTPFGDHTTNGSYPSNHVTSDRRKTSPLVKSSMMESPKSTSSSSSSTSLSGPTPTNGRTSALGHKRERDVTPSPSAKADRHRRGRDVTPVHPASAFSVFRGDRTDVTASNGERRNVTAALSAIESFVENSFGRGGRKTGITKTRASHESFNAEHGRLATDDYMTSSGDEDSGSRDDVKRRRVQQMMSTSRPEVVHQHRDVASERPIVSGRLSEKVNSSLDYLRCLSYDRPIDSEHPLECLEKLVHVQSTTPRRSALLQHSATPARASPSRHHHTGHQTETSSSRRDRTEPNNHATYPSPSRNDVIETSLKSDEVTSAEMAGAFCRPSTASTSMVC